MRQILCSFAALAALSWGGDGRPPKSSPADYPVQKETPTAIIAAVRVTAEQLAKFFPPDLAKKYVVVEVAIYPKPGPAMDVAVMDFSLQISDGIARPESPEEVASIWRPHYRGPDLPKNTRVTNETGVIVARGTNPATGKPQTSTGTYEAVGVAVGDDRRQPPLVTNSNVDADRMEAFLKKFELPEGKAAAPIAGYLYFPLPVKKNKGALELQYAHDGSTANLILLK